MAAKKSIKVAPKRRGRPSTGGRQPHVAARMPSELIAEVEAWAKANDTSLSDAFRRLVQLGLKAKAGAPFQHSKTRIKNACDFSKCEPGSVRGFLASAQADDSSGPKNSSRERSAPAGLFL